jgi:three-Cys-motif partner protein
MDLKASDGMLARKSGPWAVRKHHFLNNYCGITTKAMQGKFRLIYLDVMAGPGICKEESGYEFEGSPLVALRHQFQEYIFIEADKTLADALKKRVDGCSKTNQVKIISDDWTRVINDLNFNSGHLVVAFVDPTGIKQAPFQTMRKLAAFPRIDLLVTIQHRLSVQRNVGQFLATSEGKSALNSFLDEDSWRGWRYVDPGDFTEKVIDRFTVKMRSEGFLATRHLSVPERNPFYRFTLFCKHSLAEDFWNKVVNGPDETGQRSLFP